MIPRFGHYLVCVLFLFICAYMLEKIHNFYRYIVFCQNNIVSTKQTHEHKFRGKVPQNPNSENY